MASGYDRFGYGVLVHGLRDGVSAGERLGISLLLLPLLVTIVITIVADLDRPRHGLITINQESMRQVQALLEKNR